MYFTSLVKFLTFNSQGRLMSKFSLLYPYIIRKRVMRILRLEYQVEVFILIWHHNLVANYMEVYSS